MMTKSKCEPEQFKGKIIFMPMYNDIDWTKRGNKEKCVANALRVTEYARRFTQGHWSFLWYGTHAHKPDGEWDTTAEGMMLNPVFRASSALERGELKSKGKGVKRTVVMKRLNQSIAQLFPSISSVSTEQ